MESFMPAPYGQDLRDRVLAAYDRGKKAKEISSTFGVSPAWARRVTSSSGTAAKHAAVAVGCVREFQTKHLGVNFRLLESVARAAIFSLRLHNSDREIAGEFQKVVGSLRRFSPDAAAGHDDPAIGKLDQLLFVEGMKPPHLTPPRAV
jgi:hypothetical protein